MASYVVKRAILADALAVNTLLSEWLGWTPKSGRLSSIRRAIGNGEVLVARSSSKVIGFIHYVIHEDIIDGAPNAFISAFFVTQNWRGRRVGSLLLDKAISDCLSRGIAGVETSTIHAHARRLYERHHFKQAVGDIGEVFLELDVDEYLRAGAES